MRRTLTTPGFFSLFVLGAAMSTCPLYAVGQDTKGDAKATKTGKEPAPGKTATPAKVAENKAQAPAAKTSEKAVDSKASEGRAADSRAADSKAADKAVPLPKVSLKDATAKLNSDNHDDVKKAISDLEEIGTAQASKALATRISQGLPLDLLESATKALGEIGRAEGASALIELTNYRDPAIRIAAAKALGACRVQKAESALLDLLDEGQADVRKAAAEALQQVATKASVGRLFQAFDAHVEGVEAALGRLVKGNEINRIADQIGKRPLKDLAPALSLILSRRDVTAAQKKDVVTRLRDLNSPEANDLIRAATTKDI